MVEYLGHNAFREIDMDGKPASLVVGDIRLEWDWVKKGVESILRSSSHLTFRPEDVYAACISKEAVLWISEEGFVVTTGQTDQFTGERSMFIWLAWRKQGGDLISRYGGFLEQAALDAGFDALEAESHRAGMEKVLVKNGWEVQTVQYRKDL